MQLVRCIKTVARRSLHTIYLIRAYALSILERVRVLFAEASNSTRVRVCCVFHNGTFSYYLRSAESSEPLLLSYV